MRFVSTFVQITGGLTEKIYLRYPLRRSFGLYGAVCSQLWAATRDRAGATCRGTMAWLTGMPQVRKLLDTSLIATETVVEAADCN